VLNIGAVSKEIIEKAKADKASKINRE